MAFNNEDKDISIKKYSVIENIIYVLKHAFKNDKMLPFFVANVIFLHPCPLYGHFSPK